MTERTKITRGPATIPPGLTDALAQHDKVGRHAYDIIIWIIMQSNSSAIQPLRVTKGMLLDYFGWLNENQIQEAMRLLQDLGHIRMVQDVTTQNGYIMLSDAIAPILKGQGK